MAANLWSATAPGLGAGSNGHGSTTLEAKYRALAERYEELIAWQHRSERRTSSVARMAVWAMQASATGWAMVREGDLYFPNPAFRALSNPSPSGRGWQPV